MSDIVKEFKEEMDFFNNAHKELSEEIIIEAPVFDEEYLCEMAMNLRPSDTGLPMAIWVSTKESAGKDIVHGPRIKVMSTDDQKVKKDLMYSIGILPPHKMSKRSNVKDSDIKKTLPIVKEWINKNKETLLLYWNDEIGTSEFISMLVGHNDKFIVADQSHTGINGVIYLSNKNDIENKKNFPFGKVRLEKGNKSVTCSIILDGDEDRMFTGTDIEMRKELEKFVIKNEHALWQYWTLPKSLANTFDILSKLKKI